MASPEPLFPEREQVAGLEDDEDHDARIEAFLSAVPTHVTPIPVGPNRGRWVALGALFGFVAYLAWSVVCYVAYRLLGFGFTVAAAAVLVVGICWAFWSEERAASALLGPDRRDRPQ